MDPLFSPRLRGRQQFPQPTRTATQAGPCPVTWSTTQAQFKEALPTGQTVPIAQIALATFSNLQGLSRAGSNDFLPTLSSGAANIGAAGAAGRGTITGGSLEESNADIATEFSKLILAERGYEANARAITTFDQVTQDAINLKQ